MVFTIYLFLYEGMDHQVQQFVTLRFGDLWLELPVGPVVVLVDENLKAAAASQLNQQGGKDSRLLCQSPLREG